MQNSGPRSATPAPEEAHPDILARIDAREQEIERQLEEARRAAAGRLADARRQEAAILAAHQQEAETERSRVRAQILEEARRRAEEILAAGAREAAAVRALPPERIERAAGELLGLLLPDARAGRRP